MAQNCIEMLNFLFVGLVTNKVVIFAKNNRGMGKGFLTRVFRLYYDGFRSMTLGRTLWIIILVKLFVIFVVLKIFFFPNHIKENAAAGEEDEYVAGEMIERSKK